MLSALMRRWFNRPKRSDTRPLARFFFADEEVTRVTVDLNGVNLRKDPQKYLVLLNRLRVSQDQMLRSIELVMEDCVLGQRQSRDYHAKFPDEILHENLAVQLWFAAECLSAGSFLEVQEEEGQRLRPLAERMLQCLEEARLQLRKQSLEDGHIYAPSLREALLRYDSAFSQFELSYVSMVIPVKSAEELQRQQEIVVLFCETVDRALKLGYLKQELIDGYEPLVMFTIPRLAIICGLLIFPDGPLNLQEGSHGMSRLFSPFFTLLLKIRNLLRILSKEELYVLEKSLCAAESSGLLCSAPPGGDYKPVKATDCGGSHRQSCCSAHTFPGPLCPTTAMEREPRPGDSHMTIHPLTPQPTISPDRVPSPEQTGYASCPPAPVQECFYYYRIPAEPGGGGTMAQRTCRPSADAKRLSSRHGAGRDLRARYSSSGDMVHRLFVCISGVADQLQTNFASDMRAILKSVFELIVSRDNSEGENVQNKLMEKEVEERRGEEECSAMQEDCELCEDLSSGIPGGPPVWVPDSACDRCTACHDPFTLLRRRHHCRSCGKIFCARCSSNEAPLPRIGQRTPVRVCEHCFSFHIVGETVQL